MSETEKQEQTTMNEVETSAPIRAKSAQWGSASVRTAIISRLRRERDPVAHERLSLLCAQLKEGAPAKFIRRQIELIGRSQ